jgi:hypothetical protein
VTQHCCLPRKRDTAGGGKGRGPTFGPRRRAIASFLRLARVSRAHRRRKHDRIGAPGCIAWAPAVWQWLVGAAERGEVVGDADDSDQGAVAAYDRNALGAGGDGELVAGVR